MRKVLNIILVICLISYLSCSPAVQDSSKQTSAPDSSKQTNNPTKAKHLKVRMYIHHISDINFREQEYKIELWLYLTTRDTLRMWDSLQNQFEVAGSKELTVSLVPQFQGSGSSKIFDSALNENVFRQLLKIKCTMIQDWEVDNYPFDRQVLPLTLYTIRPLNRLILDTVEDKIKYANNETNAIENGWFFDSITVRPSIQKDIFNTRKFKTGNQYSAIKLSIPIFREKNIPLFFKLFTGMYVSFFVAFIALFIRVDHTEPRFGLPVGGLFAAIGNKYIMESILPQSSRFTIVDTLHTLTIIEILLIILFSAISLKLPDISNGSIIKFKTQRNRTSKKLKLMKWIDKNGHYVILITYVVLNVIFVTIG